MEIFKKKKKLLIIGLDGVPYEMITALAESGSMLNTKAILSTGKIARMTVTLPEISSVSWSGFMTGTDPGNHGIFGFVDLVQGSYEYRFPDFRDLSAPTFFDELGLQKKRSVIVNLPATYPARPIPGVLISGFVAPNLRKAVYPPLYYPFLTRGGYRVDIDAEKGKDQKDEFITDLFVSLRNRKEIAEFLWKKEKWDIFMFTITGTDRLHHFLYDAFEDVHHPYHSTFLEYYREVDKIIGDFAGKIAHRPDVNLILLSDHGFCAIEKEVYLNPILQQHGFLSTGMGQERSIENISKDAKAFALDPARIFIHLQGKYPRGKVAPGDYEKTRLDIKKLFEEYRIGGRKVIQKVYFKEEIYSSRFLDQAADIILAGYPGFDLKAGWRKNTAHGRTHLTGMHQRDNAFFFINRPQLLPEQEQMDILKAKDIISRSVL